MNSKRGIIVKEIIIPLIKFLNSKLKKFFSDPFNRMFVLFFIILCIITFFISWQSYNNDVAKTLFKNYTQAFNESNYKKARENLDKIIELNPSNKKIVQEAKEHLEKFDENMQKDIEQKAVIAQKEKIKKIENQKQKETVGKELIESYNAVLSRNTSNRFFRYADYDPKYAGEYYNVRVYVNQYFQNESEFYEYVALCQRTWYMMAGARKEKLVDYNPDFINIDFFDAASGEKIYTWNKNVRRPL